MASSSEQQIPAIDFSIKVERGTDEWYHLCNKVREACENYGCFEMVYNQIDPQLRKETFSVSKQLFSLPIQTKRKNVKPIATSNIGYIGQLPDLPLYESFGFKGQASNFESLRSMVEEKWPNGQHQFRTVISFVKQMDELKDMINLMILDSYGLGEKSNLILESETLLRFTQYKAPPSREETVGVPAHTDQAFSAILCDDQVSGLEMETMDGQWINLSLSPASFVFMAGDLLTAWSNGRIHAVKHRVMMSEERHSIGIFALPIDEAIIKIQKELVDEEHPRILKDFDYRAFIKFSKSEEATAVAREKHVFAFAGI